MKFQYKIQSNQTDAVTAVADCFQGQPLGTATYTMDRGTALGVGGHLLAVEGFANAALQISSEQLLNNIKEVQERNDIPASTALVGEKELPINLDVEMETGTGKTYCYIKTIFELNKRYGWSKFIVVVPSIAIREGVNKSFSMTADHFLEQYGKKARYFIYNSKQLHNLESFSSNADINVMIINIQAFNASGKDNRRIYDELDEFQSRRPIDVISANKPILILDEPQKMSGSKTLDALKKFAPLMLLRYSATHKEEHNKVYRLDALDAYNKKLVKKIAVRGISVRRQSGVNAYIYLEAVEVLPGKSPRARMEIEVKQAGGIKRVVKRFGKGDNLFDHSQQLEA